MRTMDRFVLDARRPVARVCTVRASLPLMAFALMVCVVAVVLLAALPAVAQEDTGAGVELNRIVLQVNDQILTLHDYEVRKAQQATRILANPNLSANERQEQLSRLGKQLVKASFDEMLLLSRARQMSIVVGPDRVEATIQQIRAQQGLENDADFAQALQQYGMSLEQLRDEYRREMTMQDLVSREIQDRIDLSDDALRAFYRENAESFRVAERRAIEEVIVLEESGLDARQLREVADAIIAAAKAGASLEEASASYREQELVTSVVDLGWLRSDELGEALREAAFSTPLGDYSSPTEGRGGLHILHVRDLEEGSLRTFVEVQDELRAQVRAREFGREMRVYMTELEESAFIREDLPSEAVGFRALADDAPVEQDAIDLFRAPELPIIDPDEG